MDVFWFKQTSGGEVETLYVLVAIGMKRESSMEFLVWPMGAGKNAKAGSDFFAVPER